MTATDVLSLLKGDLGIISTDTDMITRLTHLVSTAVEMINREGGDLPDGTGAAYTNEEAHLIEMYAAYLFRKRATDEGMPRMLRYALNNYLFSRRR